MQASFRKIITLTTDFGLSDSYVAQMKGVILSLAPQARIVDICHLIPPCDVSTGALLFSHAAGRFPAQTIHLGVVDPGVGSKRKRIIIEGEVSGKNFYFVGPDNGLFSLVCPKESRSAVWEIKNLQTLPTSERSRTFDGRDVFAPVAALLVSGEKPDKFGPQIESRATESILVDLAKEFEVVEKDGEVVGRIVSFDSFGNAVTNIKSVHVAAGNQRVELFSGDSATEVPLVSHYEEIPDGGLAALINSGGMLELACRQESARARFSLECGLVVKVT